MKNKFMIHVFLSYTKYTQYQTTADLLNKGSSF